MQNENRRKKIQSDFNNEKINFESHSLINGRYSDEFLFEQFIRLPKKDLKSNQFSIKKVSNHLFSSVWVCLFFLLLHYDCLLRVSIESIQTRRRIGKRTILWMKNGFERRIVGPRMQAIAKPFLRRCCFGAWYKNSYVNRLRTYLFLLLDH